MRPPQRRGSRQAGGTDRVGRAVDESEEVANVEVAEADGLVDDRNSVAQEVHQLPLELKA
jgi:hypothetical protein